MTFIITRTTVVTVALLLGAANIEAATANFTALYSFSPSGDDPVSGQPTNHDGFSSEANLLVSSNMLYGTMFSEGTNGYGTVFKVGTNGTGFTVLHTFSAPPDTVTNSDGINPQSSLVLSTNTLYGTASGGGTNGVGTVFAVNTDGTGFTNVYTFGGVSTDGNSPMAGLTLSGKTLFGTTSAGGLNGNGTVFKVNTDGTAFTNIYDFSAGSTNSYSINTNSDGSQPSGVLVLSGNVLYGTTQLGGVSGAGTVFRINTDGTSFTNLHSFNAVVTSDVQHITNSDGANPLAGLSLSGNTLYGTTYDGGTNATGTVFRLNTDGTGFTNLCNFYGVGRSSSHNIGGINPSSSLVLSGNTLYGTANQGGGAGGGTIFIVNTDGTGFTNLYSFGGAASQTNGTLPIAGLALSGNVMYGTTTGGGTNSTGTLFALTLPGPIPLNIQWTGGKMILSWTNSAFSLQVAPTVSGTFTNVPGAVSPYTNTIPGPQQFFRLQSN